METLNASNGAANKVWSNLMSFLYENEEGVKEFPSCLQINKDLKALGLSSIEVVINENDTFSKVSFDIDQAEKILTHV